MPLRLPDSLMVSVSGFRGRVGDPLTPELVGAIAAHFGAFLRGEGERGPVVLGRDSRTSGPMFARAAAAGLLSAGCDVVELGVVPTPTIMLAVEESEAAGGIGITASHNPAEWNALKFAGYDGMFLDGERMKRFQEHIRGQKVPRAAWDALGDPSDDPGAVERHLERILALDVLDVDGLRARRFKVALDCVNGAGNVIMPRLLKALGCEVASIGMDGDGRFPRDPEPTAANLEQLRDLVRESGAHVGFAVDPDVDRLSLVDEGGYAIGEDYTLALAAAPVLRRTPGPVVTNLSTSMVVEDVARAFGATVGRAPVGEINVARKMQEDGAVVGGEGNGGVILPALHLTRDAPVGACLILQHLLDENFALSDAVLKWPSYRIVKKKVEFPRDRLDAAYAGLTARFADASADLTDGLRLEWRDAPAWLHVRPSGTEPVVRLIGEASTGEEAGQLIAGGAEVLDSLR